MRGKSTKGRKQKEPVGMNPSEIFNALTVLEKERGIPKAFMLDKITQAIVAAYKKDHPYTENVEVETDEDAQTLRMYVKKNVVDEEDIGTWDLMWDPKYSRQILQFNNSRDAFGTAMYRLGLDVNSEDKADWDKALEELKTQRDLVYSYVMDEIFNIMESGEAAVCTYYGGDYLLMKDAQADNVDIRFYYPDPTNYFIDAMCIPKNCQNQELAEIFINFMLSRDAAVANAEMISYGMPNSLVYTDEEYIEDMGEEGMEILYPDLEGFTEQYNQYAFRNLEPEILDYLNTLWESVKIN